MTKRTTTRKVDTNDLADAVMKLIPRSKNQKAFMDSIINNHISFGSGSAGSGKTYIATMMACQALQAGLCDRIVVCRPVIEAGGEKLGFLPGDADEKLDPYIRPMADVINEFWQHKHKNAFNYQKGQGLIEIAPLAYMRGRSFKNVWILVDEAQNLDRDAMRMVLTRFGDGCKMIFTGDPSQRDKHYANGFEEAYENLQSVSNIGFVNFGVQDIVRHKVVQDIVSAWPE